MTQECFYNSPIGTITITADNAGITAVSLASPCKQPKQCCSDKTYMQNDSSASASKPAHAARILDEAISQLDEYFSGSRKRFELPLSPKGTEFQKKVWSALCDIEYGQTATYGAIAATSGNPKASRAVGMANNRNPIMIIVPCHRVIGSDGSLTGYAGGLEVKQFLLDLEKSNR